MKEQDISRRLRIVVSDEQTGEEVAVATGVATLVLLVASGARQDEDFHRILIGDPETSVELLLDVVQDVNERIMQGTIMDDFEGLNDQFLLEMTDGLPVQ